MSLIKIRGVEVLRGHRLGLSFSDGAVKDVGLGELLASGGVFLPICAEGPFRTGPPEPRNADDRMAGGIDLDPDVLYGNFEPASGIHVGRRTIRERTAAHA
jgi:hypothetical protein